MIFAPDAFDVYFNLTRKVWSLRDRRTGLVTSHTRAVVMPYGAKFVVRKAGRERVLREGVKNVHAFVRGERVLTSDDATDWESWLALTARKGGIQVTYNPMRAGHFMHRADGTRIDAASCVVMLATPGNPPTVWAVPQAA